jgi:hypothetical protein
MLYTIRQKKIMSPYMFRIRFRLPNGDHINHDND